MTAAQPVMAEFGGRVLEIEAWNVSWTKNAECLVCLGLCGPNNILTFVFVCESMTKRLKEWNVCIGCACRALCLNFTRWCTYSRVLFVCQAGVVFASLLIIHYIYIYLFVCPPLFMCAWHLFVFLSFRRQDVWPRYVWQVPRGVFS